MSLTPEQRETLAVFDRIGAGSVTPEDLAGVFQALGQPAPPAEKLQAMIAYVDAEQREGAKRAPASQSTPVGGNAAVRRHPDAAAHLAARNPDLPEVGTLYDHFQRAVKLYAANQFLGVAGEGGYAWRTYAEVERDATHLGSGLVDRCGLEQKHFVGVYMATRAEWTLLREANHAYNLVTVPLYDTLGADAIKHILREAELRTIVTTADKVANLLTLVAAQPGLRHVVVVGTLAADHTEAATAAGVTIHTWDAILEAGRQAPRDHRPPTPHDTALIMYTSGTTGMPKGVVHCHRSLVATIAALPAFREGDVHIAFLPLAHAMELYLEQCMITHGIAFGYFRGNVQTLLDDMQLLKPTVFASVPRLLNRIYAKVNAGLSAQTGIKRELIDLAFASKTKRLESGFVRSYWDFIAFDSVRALLGGRVRLILTGSAPIAPAVLTFFRIVFGATIQEGYGMTEVLVTNLSHLLDLHPGTVGPPGPHVEQKLESVAEMGYHADGTIPQGEVCFRGPTLMKEYYKQPELTAEMIDADGWLHSGDIGQWEPNGALKIIDRKKNIFKLAQGEYVAPERIENVMVRSPFVSQCYLHGDSLQTYPVAIVVPDPEALAGLAKQLDIGGDFEALCNDLCVVNAVHENVVQVAKAGDLKGFEIPKAIKLVPTPFTVEAGLVTPTMKLMRPHVRKVYQSTCDELYAALASEVLSPVSPAP